MVPHNDFTIQSVTGWKPGHTRNIIQAAGKVGRVVAPYLIGRILIKQYVLAFLQCAQQGVAFGALGGNQWRSRLATMASREVTGGVQIVDHGKGALGFAPHDAFVDGHHIVCIVEDMILLLVVADRKVALPADVQGALDVRSVTAHLADEDALLAIHIDLTLQSLRSSFTECGQNDVAHGRVNDFTNITLAREVGQTPANNILDSALLADGAVERILVQAAVAIDIGILAVLFCASPPRHRPLLAENRGTLP